MPVHDLAEWRALDSMHVTTPTPEQYAQLVGHITSEPDSALLFAALGINP